MISHIVQSVRQSSPHAPRDEPRDVSRLFAPEPGWTRPPRLRMPADDSRFPPRCQWWFESSVREERLGPQHAERDDDFGRPAVATWEPCLEYAGDLGAGRSSAVPGLSWTLNLNRGRGARGTAGGGP